MKEANHIIRLAVAMLLVAVMLPVGLMLTVMPAVPAYSANTTTTDISGNITAKIEFTAPSAVASWTLVQGVSSVNAETGNLIVKCNTSWTATVADSDGSNTIGFMTSYNGTSGNLTYQTGTKLANEMHVICVAEGTNVTLPGAATIATGVVGDQGQADAGENFTIQFSQTVEYIDPWLDASAGYYYRIVVTFAATID